MRQKKSGGTIMLKELNIDDNVSRWVPTLKAHLNGKKCYCPICKSDNLKIDENYENGVGFVLITCNDCKISGYFSRVIN